MFSLFYLLLGVTTVLAAASLAFERSSDGPVAMHEAQRAIGVPIHMLPGQSRRS